MSDLISRSALMNELARNSIVKIVVIGDKTVWDIVKDQPTIEAVERNKVIDEFVKRCKEDLMCKTFGLHPNGIEKIANEMKGEEHEID